MARSELCHNLMFLGMALRASSQSNPSIVVVGLHGGSFSRRRFRASFRMVEPPWGFGQPRVIRLVGKFISDDFRRLRDCSSP